MVSPSLGAEVEECDPVSVDFFFDKTVEVAGFFSISSPFIWISSHFSAMVLPEASEGCLVESLLLWKKALIDCTMTFRLQERLLTELIEVGEAGVGAKALTVASVSTLNAAFKGVLLASCGA